MSNSTEIFNRSLLKTRRNRLASRDGDIAFLKDECCERLADRLADMARDFPLALDLGCHHGALQSVLNTRGNIHRLVQCDLAEQLVKHAVGERVVADEEWLPFADNTFDAVLSAGSLHWVNDLPGTLVQIHRILKSDGLFLAILPGANTLRELRESLAAVEAQTGAMRPHIAPFVEVRDAGNLLQRAGFALPVVDSDILTLTYDSPLKLLQELRAMGENNHLTQQDKHILPRDFFARVCAHYMDHYCNEEGRIEATIELITLTAWTPHASQQQPAKRGSGKVNLGDYLT